MEIKEYRFKDLMSTIIDNRGKTCPTAEKGMPLIATNCIKNDKLYPVFEKVRYVSSEVLKNWFRGHPLPGDIIFVCKGAPGRVALTPDPVNFCIAQDMLALRANEDIIDPKFLFALLRSKRTQLMINNMHVGTLIPHFKKGDFDSLFLKIPSDKNIQKKVGIIYYELSQKIHLLRQQNATLEAMAQALFKSWFVDFDPVIDNALAAGRALPEALAGRVAKRRAVLASGEYPGLPEGVKGLFPDGFVFSEELGRWVPEGWEVKSIKETTNVTDFVANGSFASLKQNVTLFDSPEYALYIRTTDAKNNFSQSKAKYTDQHSFEFLRKTRLDGHEVIISNVGDTGTVFRPPVWKKMPMTLGSNAIALTEKEVSNYLFELFNHKFGQGLIQGIVGGSAQPKFNKTDFRSLMILVPSEDMLSFFNNKTEPIYSKVILNNERIQTLTRLRDVLLPELISGRLEV